MYLCILGRSLVSLAEAQERMKRCFRAAVTVRQAVVSPGGKGGRGWLPERCNALSRTRVGSWRDRLPAVGQVRFGWSGSACGNHTGRDQDCNQPRRLVASDRWNLLQSGPIDKLAFGPVAAGLLPALFRKIWIVHRQKCSDLFDKAAIHRAQKNFSHDLRQTAWNLIAAGWKVRLREPCFPRIRLQSPEHGALGTVAAERAGLQGVGEVSTKLGM